MLQIGDKKELRHNFCPHNAHILKEETLKKPDNHGIWKKAYRGAKCKAQQWWERTL